MLKSVWYLRNPLVLAEIDGLLTWYIVTVAERGDMSDIAFFQLLVDVPFFAGT